MPRTRALTAGLREDEHARACNEVMARAIRRSRVDTEVQDKELIERVSVGKTTLWRWKKDPGIMSLNQARALARELHISREDWLAVGGYRA